MPPPGSRLKKAPKPYTMNPTPMGVRMEPKDTCESGSAGGGRGRGSTCKHPPAAAAAAADGSTKAACAGTRQHPPAQCGSSAPRYSCQHPPQRAPQRGRSGGLPGGRRRACTSHRARGRQCAAPGRVDSLGSSAGRWGPRRSAAGASWWCLRGPHLDAVAAVKGCTAARCRCWFTSLMPGARRAQLIVHDAMSTERCARPLDETTVGSVPRCSARIADCTTALVTAAALLRAA